MFCSRVFTIIFVLFSFKEVFHDTKVHDQYLYASLLVLLIKRLRFSLSVILVCAGRNTADVKHCLVNQVIFPVLKKI